jgi:hypothetical protein
MLPRMIYEALKRAAKQKLKKLPEIDRNAAEISAIVTLGVYLHNNRPQPKSPVANFHLSVGLFKDKSQWQVATQAKDDNFHDHYVASLSL